MFYRHHQNKLLTFLSNEDEFVSFLTMVIVFLRFLSVNLDKNKLTNSLKGVKILTVNRISHHPANETVYLVSSSTADLPCTRIFVSEAWREEKVFWDCFPL